MAYVIHNNQTGVPANLVKYRFDRRIEGKRERKTVVCMRSAVRDIYQKWEREISENKSKPSYKNNTFFEIIDRYYGYLQTLRTESALRHDEYNIWVIKQYFDENMLLQDFRRTHVFDFVQWRRTHPLNDRTVSVSNATIKRNISTLSAFFNWATVNEYYERANPVIGVKIPVHNEREIQLTENMVQELYDKSYKQGNGRGIYVVVMLTLQAGLRKGEIFSLSWSDVDFENARIRIQGPKSKSHRMRMVPMPDTLREHLQCLKNADGDVKQVFHDFETVAKIEFDWKRLRQSLSFNPLPNGLNLRLHDLRHVYAQNLRDAGVSLGDIQTFLGHSSVQVTERRYAQFGGKNGVEKVNRIKTVVPVCAKV